MHAPSISCICVSDGHLENVLGSINCFLKQRCNKKMLLIFHDFSAEQVKKLRNVIGMSTAIQLMPLEDLVNDSWHEMLGDYIAAWDPACWYHQNRLIQQQQILESFHKPATALIHTLIFDLASTQCFNAPRAIWTNTLFFKKDQGIEFIKIFFDAEYNCMNDESFRQGLYPDNRPQLAVRIVDRSSGYKGHITDLLACSLLVGNSLSAAVSHNILQRFELSNDDIDLNSGDLMAGIQYTFLRHGNLV